MELTLNLTELAPYIGLIALYFAVRNYRRKSGIYIRGQYSISSTIYAEDKYISSITLENSKDRSVIIFKIFIRVGSNYYIEMNDFESEPKILKSYESFTCNYDPVDFYYLNLNRIKMNKILDSRKSKINIVLSTSQGKYVIRKSIKRWDPVFDFFRNHLTACIQPMYPLEKAGHYGSDFKYLAKITTENGYTNTIPIYATDINYPRFENFALTTEAISSRETLENYLLEQAINGHLKCTKVEVIDAEELRTRNYGHTFTKTVEAVHFNWFTYRVIGRLSTVFSNQKLSYMNHKLRKKR
ncbi:hypothetical protein WDQ92_003079 [Enterobacter hormaechei]|uniref:hypothetical protein n=1 Tax=Enterobacter hormaechei TaxID=158836 RepID=UPI0028218F06|nr:hypothetical protein [Enterobacter hormaechei]ELB7312524.1 hypothetical protein [Enterobacter hormaechei]ELQ3561189.1 hypothetical protein [Enterobacter hormaechei]MCM8084182.1 hypothetical protein [Enterobacter hormaechei]MDR9960040.1 hypothetical protein [Enterobacter hormaechei subsp. xiangfangensis]HEC1440716.1 hypothetical protein [Enterobacter hormaechei]